MRSKDVRRFKIYGQRSLAVLFLAGATFLFLRGALRMYDRYSTASEARRSTVAEAQSLKERKATLQARIDTLSSDRGLEEELRRRYGVAKDGEGVIEVVAEVPQAPPATPEKGFIGWLKRVF